MNPAAELIELASQLLATGRLAEASNLCLQVVANAPDSVDAWHLLGVIALQDGRHEQAIEHLRKAFSLDNSNAEVQNNLGLAYVKIRDYSSAIASFRRATALRSGFAEAAYNLANCLSESAQFREAEVAYQQAIRLNPDFAAAHLNLGELLGSQGRFDEAVVHYQTALRIRPGHAETYMGLGLVFQRQGRLEEANSCYCQATSARPDLLEAHNRLGTCLRALGLLDNAAACFRHILNQDPNHVEALTNLGNTLKDAGEVDAAIDCFRRAINSSKGFVPAQSNLLYSLYFSTKYDAAAIYGEHVAWGNHRVQAFAKSCNFRNEHGQERPLRIGYVSPYFRNHCQSFFLAPLFRSHDRSNFEIYCYYDNPVSDDLTGFFQSHCDAWRSLVGQTDEAAATMIREDRIDILVDLTMHMGDGRPLLFARKPAPIQVCWLAYPGTTGLATMDYRLTDPYLDPGCDDHFYTEKSIRLPDSFWCYDPLTSQPDVNPLPAMTNSYVTFGSLNNFCKVNDGVLRLWAQVMRAVPESRLLLLTHQGSHRNRTLDFLQRESISPDRVAFASLRPRDNYLKLFHEFDIGLDTWPANGHTTTLDSLWMGVPVVTLNGATAIGRGAASILHNIGLPDLIASSPEQYVEIATNLAADQTRLMSLRDGLRARLTESPLMDAPHFTRNIEAAFRAMWQTWCAQQT